MNWRGSRLTHQPTAHGDHAESSHRQSFRLNDSRQALHIIADFTQLRHECPNAGEFGDEARELHMDDLTKASDGNTVKIMAIVEELQPVSAKRVREELSRRHAMEADLDQLVRYMEWLRSGFPRKLAHAGPDAWVVIDLA